MAIVSITTDPEYDWMIMNAGITRMKGVEFRIGSGWVWVDNEARNSADAPKALVIYPVHESGLIGNAGLGFTLTPEVVAGLKKVVEAAEAALKE